jgi:hypothetical protein
MGFLMRSIPTASIIPLEQWLTLFLTTQILIARHVLYRPYSLISSQHTAKLAIVASGIMSAKQPQSRKI